MLSSAVKTQVAKNSKLKMSDETEKCLEVFWSSCNLRVGLPLKTHDHPPGLTPRCAKHTALLDNLRAHHPN